MRAIEVQHIELEILVDETWVTIEPSGSFRHEHSTKFFLKLLLVFEGLQDAGSRLVFLRLWMHYACMSLRPLGLIVEGSCRLRPLDDSFG